MQNYSDVFAATLALYESCYVPGDQGDAGKGQVTARAVFTIYSTMNPHIGYIAKNPGQTQYYGIAVDACQDKSDGYGADYLTDELQPDGRRLIKLAYTPYPTPASPPDTGWVQPTAAMLEHPGPLTLKGGTAPEPEPEPEPPPDDTAVTDALARIEATLAAMQEQQASDTTAVLEAIAHFEARFNTVVEDAEDTLQALLPWLIILLRDDDSAPRGKAKGSAAADAAANLHAWVAQRKATGPR